MKEYLKRNETQSHVLASKAKTLRQTPLSNMLFSSQMKKNLNFSVFKSNVCQRAVVANINCPRWGNDMALGSAIHSRIQSLFLANAVNGRVEIAHGVPHPHIHDLGDHPANQYRYGEIKPNTPIGIVNGLNQIAHHAAGQKIAGFAVANLQFALNQIDPHVQVAGAVGVPQLRVQNIHPGLFVYDGI